MTVLVGVGFAAVVVLYASLFRDYLGHRQKRISSAETIPIVATYTPAVEQVVEASAEETPAEATPITAEPAPTFAPSLYETVQPALASAPVAFPTSSVTSFGTSVGVKKPTRTYRRRPAPVRRTSASKPPYGSKSKRS